LRLSRKTYFLNTRFSKPTGENSRVMPFLEVWQRVPTTKFPRSKSTKFSSDFFAIKNFFRKLKCQQKSPSHKLFSSPLRLNKNIILSLPPFRPKKSLLQYLKSFILAVIFQRRISNFGMMGKIE